jgi:hypothetical protein
MPRSKSGGVVEALMAEVKGDLVAKGQETTTKSSQATACG